VVTSNNVQSCDSQARELDLSAHLHDRGRCNAHCLGTRKTPVSASGCAETQHLGQKSTCAVSSQLTRDETALTKRHKKRHAYSAVHSAANNLSRLDLCSVAPQHRAIHDSAQCAYHGYTNTSMADTDVPCRHLHKHTTHGAPRGHPTAMNSTASSLLHTLPLCNLPYHEQSNMTSVTQLSKSIPITATWPPGSGDNCRAM
jgi:hypothetical protein